jgi:hypothetical protein
MHSNRWWPVILTAVVGVLGVAGWWLAPFVMLGIASFLGANISDKANFSSIISMVTGFASLFATVVLGIVQIRGARRERNGPTPTLLRERDAVGRLRAHLGRRARLHRMGDAGLSAISLRVHPAVELSQNPQPPDSSVARSTQSKAWPRRLINSQRSISPPFALDPDLPMFVEREIGPVVESWMYQARSEGGFLLLVGDSSVGKTRLLYEAAKRQLSDFAVLAPDLGDGGLVSSIAEATFALPKLIVWLDELQRFLDGPHLTPGSTPVTATAIRQLLDAPTPVVIIGTLWPEYAAELYETETDHSIPPGRVKYPNAVDLIDAGHVVVTGHVFVGVPG